MYHGIKRLLNLWVPTEMMMHNIEIGINVCIYFLSNCSWCITLNFFFFWWEGNIWRSLGTMILFIGSREDELMKLVAILGLWWNLRTFWWFLQNIIIVSFSFIKKYTWCNRHVAHDFPYTPQTAEYLALDPIKHLDSIIKEFFFKKNVLEA